MLFSHIFWVLFVMEIDVALYPIDVRLLRTDTIMFTAHYAANPIEQPRFVGYRGHIATIEKTMIRQYVFRH
jgi:hypothetical protein